MKNIAILLLLATFSATAQSACLLNGTLYPTGATVGGLTCQADGTWK